MLSELLQFVWHKIFRIFLTLLVFVEPEQKQTQKDWNFCFPYNDLV